MLKIENVSKTFNAGTVNEKVALRGLNLHLKEAEAVETKATVMRWKASSSSVVRMK